MSAVPDFVSELCRSANEVSKVSAFERRRLVERAATTIAEQRARLSAAGNVISMPSGVVAGLDTLLSQLDGMPDQLMSHIFLECADEIRKLHIVGANID